MQDLGLVAINIVILIVTVFLEYILWGDIHKKDFSIQVQTENKNTDEKCQSPQKEVKPKKTTSFLDDMPRASSVESVFNLRTKKDKVNVEQIAKNVGE